MGPEHLNMFDLKHFAKLRLFQFYVLNFAKLLAKLEKFVKFHGLHTGVLQLASVRPKNGNTASFWQRPQKIFNWNALKMKINY